VAADIIPFIGGVFREHYEWPEEEESEKSVEKNS
jgi:hypothetical protein